MLEVLAGSLVLDESRCLVTHRISRRSRDLSNMEAEMSGSVYSARQHAIRVRRHRREMRQRMTLNVILCALLVSSPERTVWTLPRNDWWARDVTAAIDINAWPWPNEMFTLNLRKCGYTLFYSAASRPVAPGCRRLPRYSKGPVPLHSTS